jgi:integrase/recombinase XerD
MLAFYDYHLLGLQRFLLAKNEPFTAASFITFVQQLVLKMRDKHMAQDTIACRIRSCRRFFRFLYPDQKWTPISLVAKASSQRKLHCFTREEIQTILNHPDQQTFVGYRDYVIMLVFLDTGIRLAELSNLQLDDILLFEQSIRISRSKSGKSRYVSIGSTCLKNLQSYIKLRGDLPFRDLWITRNNRPFKRGAILKMISKRCRGALQTITRGSAHTFRHTMSRMFLMNGGSVYALQHILGHTTLEMTRKYVCLLAGDLQVQHEKWSPIESLLAYAEENSNRKELRQWK